MPKKAKKKKQRRQQQEQHYEADSELSTTTPTSNGVGIGVVNDDGAAADPPSPLARVGKKRKKGTATSSEMHETEEEEKEAPHHIDNDETTMTTTTTTTKKKLNKKAKLRMEASQTKPKLVFRPQSMPTLNGLSYHHLHQLLLWCSGVEVQPPTWFNIDYRFLIRKVVVVVVDGLTESMFRQMSMQVPELLRRFPSDSCTMPCVLSVQTSVFERQSAATALYNCSMTKLMGRHKTKKRPHHHQHNKKHKRGGGDAASSAAAAASPPHPPSFYKLTPDQLIELGFPNEALEGFEPTRPPVLAAAAAASASSSSAHTAAEPRLFAIDCEMCMTEAGSELTRLTLVDAEKRVVYDELVKPALPIVNYCTQYSGITAEMMTNVTNTLENARRSFLDVVCADDILIGHSVENDLNALRVNHRSVVDTVVLYPHPKGTPHRSKLSYLANRLLKRKIQHDEGGHDSVEDAIAALDLALLKFRHGPEFGMPSRDTVHVMRVLDEKKRPCALVANTDVQGLCVPSTSAIVCDDDEAVTVKGAKEVAKNSDGSSFVALHFTGVYEACDADATTKFEHVNNSDAAAAPGVDPYQGNDTNARHALGVFNGRLIRVLDACPPNSLMVVMSGQASTALYSKMQSRYLELMKAGATHAHITDERLKSLHRELQRGVVFAAIHT